MSGVQSTLRRACRRCGATCNTRVIVRSDGTLSMDGRHPEREEVGGWYNRSPRKYPLDLVPPRGWCINTGLRQHQRLKNC
ncbi:hypothetical protein NDU88_005921 [Pleurodeles waltl]|uniref:4Fe-4S Mo/W bis-MGD-type domain-containing protein n=1 Tax=Pleurodeles waltl TaxID=8319 RepID=A0AAV7PJE5_PLEWA|nr:hypothetical protein NDU88_005921 [Pleurodeles waltl]